MFYIRFCFIYTYINKIEALKEKITLKNFIYLFLRNMLKFAKLFKYAFKYIINVFPYTCN